MRIGVDLNKFSGLCVHTKNVLTLIDTPVQSEGHKKMLKHLDNCSICKEEWSIFLEKNEAIKIYIPKPFIAQEAKETFESEVRELFKIFNLDEKEKKKKNWINQIKQLDAFGVSVLETLSSKKMLKVYLLSAFVFVLLKRFF